MDSLTAKKNKKHFIQLFMSGLSSHGVFPHLYFSGEVNCSKLWSAHTAVDGGSLTVVVALAGCVGQDHLHAAVGRVVGALALLAEHVADAVGVLFVKLREEEPKKRAEVRETLLGNAPEDLVVRLKTGDRHSCASVWKGGSL